MKDKRAPICLPPLQNSYFEDYHPMKGSLRLDCHVLLCVYGCNVTNDICFIVFSCDNFVAFMLRFFIIVKWCHVDLLCHCYVQTVWHLIWTRLESWLTN